jgi:hypothetical protein
MLRDPHEQPLLPESIADDDAQETGSAHERPGLFPHPTKAIGDVAPATATGQGDADADACMALPIAERLAETAAGLIGVPAKLLGCDCLTASIYVEAATRSLRYAAEVIKTDASRQTSQIDDDEIDPRLLEWLS